MVNALDPRIVRIGIELDDQVVKWYEGLDIKVTGTKYANAQQNECEVKIANLDRKTRDFIVTETSPFNLNRKRKGFIVEAGRKSYGASRIFVGDITRTIVSQPPDIVLSICSNTKDHAKGDVVARNGGGRASLKALSTGVASDLKVALDFQATDKTISNYSFTGGSLNQVDKLGEFGDVDAYIDDDKLIVKDANIPLTGRTRILSAETGMIGIPEITEEGLKVKMLLDNQTTLGGGLTIQSKLNPATNGNYAIFKLGFSITSREKDFYWIAEAKRLK